MGTSGNIHFRDQPRVIKRTVFFEGDGAVKQGVGLCYNPNVVTTASGQTASDSWGRRMASVDVPSNTNNNFFAGVAAFDYTARTGGQEIAIYEPGSTCQVAIGMDTVIETTRMVCSAGTAVTTAGHQIGDAGRFSQAAKLPGRGVALALQTNTSGRIGEGVEKGGALTGSGLILTDTGQFASSVAGDSVYIYAGEPDVTAAEYIIASVTSDDVVVLTTAAASSDELCSYYTQSGNQTVLAYLFDGEESGLCEWVSIVTAVATQSMAGGMSLIDGNVTHAGDATSVLADGLLGDANRKYFEIEGTITTKDYIVTVTSGLKEAGGALATLVLDADTEYASVIWDGTNWRVLGKTCTET